MPVLGVGLSILLIISVNTADASFIKLEQNGYNNILVRIDDDVPIGADCTQTLTDLQAMLQETSNALCTALEGRAYFRNVTILIPSHWTANGNCLVDTNITWPRTHMSDLIVGQDHPVFGRQSFTLNYGGCGVSSLPVRLPIGYLTAPARGVAIAHEWFHYRYGVFDEIGVGGDPLYPKGYQIKQPEAEILPTSCTNEPLQGEWVGNEWQNGNDNGNITSSMMFSTDLPNINRICTANNHLKAPPTKHNWLCGSRSVSEIVYSHQDFIAYNNTPAMNCSQTRFNVATNPHRGYHIILDVTSAMAVNEPNLLENAVFAASHFVWFLPEGSTVSIDTFSDVHSQIQTPITLNLTTKNAILSHLDKLSVRDNNNTAGLSSALNNAIRMFRIDGLEIILITAAQEVPSDFNIYVDEFRRNLIAPHILALSVATSNIFSSLARDGWLHFVPVRTDASIPPEAKYRNAQTWMIDTLQSVYSRTRSYRAKIEEKTLQMVDGWNNGTFQVESSATSLIFAFYHLDDGLSMTFHKGSLFSPLNEECDIVLLRTLSLYSADCGNITYEKGTWSYFIYVDGTSTVRLDSWFSSNSISPIRVETWTNSIKNQPIDWKSERVVIYAQVSQQQKAVSGLSLVAHINGNNETESVFSVSLNENNPSDVTKGDGIYSAQLTNLPRSSIRFSYVVEIVNGVGTVDAGTYNRHPTAGSLIPSGQPSPLPSFNRFVYGGSFQLSLPYDGRDVLPPGRITDLSISDYDSQNSSVELKWTGPKDDYDASSTLVNRFIITGEDDWSDSKESVFYNGTIQPLPGTLNGMIFTADVVKSNKSRNVYYRVYGLDSSGNQGQSSNVVAVYVPAGIITPTNPAGDPSLLPPALYWFLIGLACVCAILILAIILACVRRYRDAKKREAMGSDWVQIGETSIEPSKLPESKNLKEEMDKVVVPQVPDFNSYLTPSPQRRGSNEYVSSRWSNNSYESTESESYSRSQVIFTEARIETPSDSPLRPAIRKSLPTYSFGGDWNNVPSPTSRSTSTTVSSSPGKKVPPAPPPRKYHPYSFERSNDESKSKTKLQFGDNINETPLASSPSYLASQLKKQDVSYLERGALPKTYSMQTLSSASNSSISRFGMVLGADSEASLV